MRVRPVRPARSHRLQLLVAAFVPALIVVLSVTGFVWAQKDVTVVVDGRTHYVKTQAPDVATLLDEMGVTVDSADLVTPALDASLSESETVVVRHSVPVVLNLGGERLRVDVVGQTVADALVSVGADPSQSAGVVPSVTTRLRPGMTIDVPDVFVRVVREETTVAPPVRYEDDPTLPRGEKRVVTRGRPGTMLRVYRVLVLNGHEGQPVLTASRVVVRPTARVIAVGTASKRRLIRASHASSQAKPPVGGRRMRVVSTAYSAKQPGLDDTTATGARAVRGVIAVDPRVIPLGTRVYVPGYGFAKAADTGGAIKGMKIDLCFDTVAEAIRWGRRTVTIIILD